MGLDGAGTRLSGFLPELVLELSCGFTVCPAWPYVFLSFTVDRAEVCCFVD